MEIFIEWLVMVKRLSARGFVSFLFFLIYTFKPRFHHYFQLLQSIASLGSEMQADSSVICSIPQIG